MIICRICNKKFKNYLGIGPHIKRVHKISTQSYYDTYYRNYANDDGFCLVCGTETRFRNLNHGYRQYCSKKCSAINQINKYGSPFSKSSVQDKIKKTIYDKYGVDNPLKADSILKKRNETNIAKYGGKSPACSKEVEDKKKKTCLEKYGVEYALQANGVKNKAKETILKRYDVNHPQQSELIKEKAKQTCLEKYGVEHPMKDQNIKEKVISSRKNKNLIGSINNKPLFSFYASKIGWVEEVRKDLEDKTILNVKCKKCWNWFVPNLQQIGNRVQSLNGNRGTVENNLYCSDKCKNTCSIFGKVLYQEDHPKKLEEIRHHGWSKMVKEKANFQCEKCGSDGNLVAHHIQPVKGNEILANDIDNGICVCENCHKEMHQIDGCKTSELANIKC